MICPNCEREIPDDSKFCPDCGYNIMKERRGGNGGDDTLQDIIPQNGFGKKSFKDGSRYEGEWLDGKVHGMGKYFFPNGHHFEGGFKDGKMHGFGKMFYANGEHFEGFWESGELPNSVKYFYVDGSRYEGEWKDGIKHGFGKMFHPDGSRYEGEWNNGKENGFGKCYFVDDGHRYEGELKDGRIYGFGKMFYPDGSCYEGFWENGHLVNSGKTHKSDTTNKGERKDDNSGILEITVNGVLFKMIRVEHGAFTMCKEISYDAHLVTLTNDYYIGEIQVTQALWKAVMGSNPSYFRGDNLPVESVSWNECQEFIQKLNAETGRKFRLPTEAEWEFAARGGNKSKGYKYSGSNDPINVAWYCESSDFYPQPVAHLQPNELGIYDMSGSVFEWCNDYYDNGIDYFESEAAQTNPPGPQNGEDRVCRGGAWCSPAGDCLLSNRYWGSPDERATNIGFRLALSE